MALRGAAQLMIIPKAASDPARFRRPLFPTANCRSAIELFLRSVGATEGTSVLIPAYIGWSPKEGSGIHDPILAAGASLAFYRMGRDLSIDLEHLESQLAAVRPKVVLFVHYFGFPDRRLAEGVNLAHAHGALALEDEAHALFSDMIGGVCGRYGDAAVYSMHKMFPFKSGGGIVVNNLSPIPQNGSFLREGVGGGRQDPTALECHNPFDYDLAAIAARRLANANAVLKEVLEIKDIATPLYESIPTGVIPQTLPVLIDRVPREQVYNEMNARGYGVVSLYHTMIEPIRENEFPDSHWLARRILNLPVHQDIEPSMAGELVSNLKQVIAG